MPVSGFTKTVAPIPESLLEEIQAMGPLSEVIPYIFTDNSESQISKIEVNCAKCHQVVPMESIYGTIDEIAGGQSIRMQAYAVCRQPECFTITPVIAKFFSGGEALYKGPGEIWVKSRWNNHLNMKEKTIGYLMRHWQQILPPVMALIIFVGWVVLLRGEGNGMNNLIDKFISNLN
jgi:hypothetical protein